MILRPPRSTLPDTPFPTATLFRSRLVGRTRRHVAERAWLTRCEPRVGGSQHPGDEGGHLATRHGLGRRVAARGGPAGQLPPGHAVDGTGVGGASGHVSEARRGHRPGGTGRVEGLDRWTDRWGAAHPHSPAGDLQVVDGPASRSCRGRVWTYG